MDPDEGPYRQSDRTDALPRRPSTPCGSGGVLYACDCTRAEIDARTKANATPGYDGYCRDRGLGARRSGASVPGRPTRGPPWSTT